MQITVDIDEARLAAAIIQASGDLLAGPKFSHRGAPIYEIIVEATRRVLSEMDFTTRIQAEVERLIPGVVNEVTEKALRDMVKKQVKTLKDEGALLPGVETTEGGLHGR